jgi:hypothetical protein
MEPRGVSNNIIGVVVLGTANVSTARSADCSTQPGFDPSAFLQLARATSEFTDESTRKSGTLVIQTK